MKKQDAISYFGTRAALARAVGITRQAVNEWKEFVPPTIAALLEEMTDGALVFDPASYPESYRRPGRPLWTPSLPAPTREVAQA
ncbi:MAG: Cro/CI family transcriptional regulator [Nitrosomonas ureae]